MPRRGDAETRRKTRLRVLVSPHLRVSYYSLLYGQLDRLDLKQSVPAVAGHQVDIVQIESQCAIAGADLSLAQSAGFFRDMTAGRGYLALAALIFGKWRPMPTLLACLLFAFADAVQTRLQGVALPWIGVIPVQFIQALPYILTVLLLAGFVGKARPPKAIGMPYVTSR